MKEGIKVINFFLSGCSIILLLSGSVVYATTADDVVCMQCVDATDVSNSAITTVKIAPNAVTSGRIAVNAVTTTRISAGAVTAGRLGVNAVTSSRIKDGEVRTQDIRDQAVTEAKLDSVLQAKIVALESAVTDNDFSGYYLPFSVAGNPKNVIVLRRVNFDDTVSYYLRVRHTNGQSISVNGTPTFRTNIASYGFASASGIGSTDATFASEYIESPETTAYLDYLIESSTFDLNNGNARIVDQDSERWIDNSVVGTNGLRVGTVNVEVNGVLDRVTHFNTQYIGKVPTFTIGDLVFNDVAAQQRLGGGYTRYRAQGIGEIMREQNGQPTRFVIYYRVNGQTGGSLNGTPFEPSVGNLDGLFFTP